MSDIFHQSSNKYIQTITERNFDDITIQLFHYQYSNNSLYKEFVDAIGVKTDNVQLVSDIPFLPVSFFKSHKVVTGHFDPVYIFESSTTTSDIPARHFIRDEELYLQSLISGFQQFYSSAEQYAFLALLPSYLQRGNASLVHMADALMNISRHTANGFYLDDLDKLYKTLNTLEQQKQPTILLGVTFALLDFAEQYSMNLKNTIVMETGGMKGRRREMIREEVHEDIKSGLGVTEVHSEYGMTELLSQAYAVKDGKFRTSNTMRVFVRDVNDPFDVRLTGSGLLNIIDLANIHSCAFIATDDIGKIYPDGHFEVLGRADNSALRGCNLMVL